MVVDGPLTLEELVDSIPSDTFNDEVLETTTDAAINYWEHLTRKAKDDLKESSGNTVVLMTPLSKGVSGTLSRLSDIWESSLETPNHNQALFNARKPSPDSLPIGSPSRKSKGPFSILNDDIDVTSSPKSHIDIFQPVIEEPEKGRIFDRLTGLIEDSTLDGVTQLTPLAMKTERTRISETSLDNESRIDEEPDLVFEDLEDLDFGDGLTQLYQMSDEPLQNQKKIMSIGFSTANGKTIAEPSAQSLKRAEVLLEFDETPIVKTELVGFSFASGKNIPPPTELNLKRASDLFKDIELYVGTPITPLMAMQGDQPVRSSLGVSILNYSQSSLKENSHEINSNGFTLATGKTLPPPSGENLNRAKRLLEEISKDTSPTIGFSSAGGKRLKPPSEESLNFANKLLKDQDTISKDNIGFSSAGGKVVKPPSKASLDEARDLLSGGSETNRSEKASGKKPNQMLAMGSKRTLGIGSHFKYDKKSKIAQLSKASPKTVNKCIDLKYFDLTRNEPRQQLKDIKAPDRLLKNTFTMPLDRDQIYFRFSAKGIDLNLISQDWAMNHIELIYLKVKNTIKFFPKQALYGNKNIETVIVEQLLYRYEREINQAHRSVLKKICEGDDTPAGLFVFFIKEIKPFELLLSDGWYSLWTIIDLPLNKLVENGRLFVGQKIQVTNLGLIKNDPCTILEAEQQGFKLKIVYNSTRMCRWHVKLGRQRSKTFLRPMKTVIPDGGLIPCLDMVVIKRYPDIVTVSFEDGCSSEKSKREWENILNNPLESEERPLGASKTVRMICRDNMSNSLVSVKIFSVPEDLSGKFVIGRSLRLLNLKPQGISGALELRAYQGGRQAIPMGMSTGIHYQTVGFDDIESFKTGKEYSGFLTIIRQNSGENFVWALTTKGKLISIQLGSHGSVLPKFCKKESVQFHDLEYQYHDSNYNFDVFMISVVSDWERGSPPTTSSICSEVIERAVKYVDNLVCGKISGV